MNALVVASSRVRIPVSCTFFFLCLIFYFPRLGKRERDREYEQYIWSVAVPQLGYERQRYTPFFGVCPQTQARRMGLWLALERSDECTGVYFQVNCSIPFFGVCPQGQARRMGLWMALEQSDEYTGVYFQMDCSSVYRNLATKVRDIVYHFCQAMLGKLPPKKYVGCTSSIVLLGLPINKSKEDGVTDGYSDHTPLTLDACSFSICTRSISRSSLAVGH